MSHSQTAAARQPEIIEVTPQGYCGGVRKAIARVLEYRQAHPQEPMTLLGALVHNRYVSEALKKQNIRVLEKPGATRLELLEQVQEGTVVFTAHGVSDEVRQAAAKKGLRILDASCPFVCTTQKLVREKTAQGMRVFYIGKKGHPEAEAIYLHAPQVTLIEKEEDIPRDVTGPVFVTNQTTMSLQEIDHLFQAIQKACPQAEFADELCSATRVRQQAVLDLAGQGFDLLVVAGDPSSNNSRKLQDAGRKAGIPHCLLCESARDLQSVDLSQFHKIALTSGASTPKAIRAQILELLRTGHASSIDLDTLLQTG